VAFHEGDDAKAFFNLAASEKRSMMDWLAGWLAGWALGFAPNLLLTADLIHSSSTAFSSKTI
jgi:hypothetical protein